MNSGTNPPFSILYISERSLHNSQQAERRFDYERVYEANGVMALRRNMRFFFHGSLRQQTRGEGKQAHAIIFLHALTLFRMLRHFHYTLSVFEIMLHCRVWGLWQDACPPPWQATPQWQELAPPRGFPLRQGKQRVWDPTPTAAFPFTPTCRGRSPQAPTFLQYKLYEMR